MGGRGSTSGLGNGGYRTFRDKAYDTHEYDGSGTEQVAFFKANSNYDELINNMTDDQIRAFGAYTEGSFMGGQQYDGWDSMSDYEKRRTQAYDDVLDKATLGQGVELTRRSSASLVLGKGERASLDKLQAAEGSIVTSKGNMSFGAASEGLTIGQRGKNVEYKLRISGGTTGAGMWVGDRRINGWGPKQREFMTNRDIVMKVGKTTYNSSRGVYTVELEYMGREAHDYGKSGRL